MSAFLETINFNYQAIYISKPTWVHITVHALYARGGGHTAQISEPKIGKVSITWVENFVCRFKCMPVGRTSDSVPVPT